MMGKLKEQMGTFARTAGGHFKTIHDRQVIVERLAEQLQELNIQITNVSHLTSKHIENFIRFRLDQGILKRTLHNEMSAIRAVLIKAGREKLARSERISNRVLGLSGASRTGTKVAITQERYEEVILDAMKRNRGMAACLQLSMALGLRAEEAVQSDKSLKTWSKMLSKQATRLPVTYGTKSGKPREVTIICHEQVCKAVQFAMDVAAQNQGGHLIDTPDLKSALNKFSNEARALGLIGVNSPHSLRYAWAQARVAAYLEEDLSEKETLARTSCDLGHGDGRGQYIRSVYCQKIIN